MIGRRAKLLECKWPRTLRSSICSQCLIKRSAPSSTLVAQDTIDQSTTKHQPREKRNRVRPPSSSRDTFSGNDKWEVTVGLEIHAQLNAKRKLFSNAKTSFNALPNTQVAMFDAAIPGTQPKLNLPTILPALRAAVALHCKINRRSSFDRKHYFYKDQPCGYQITQFYEALANDGHLVLTERDGLVPADEFGSTIEVGIKQIQLEQDTAKSLYQASNSPSTPSYTLIDYNRAASPLIEIITTPSLHSSHHASLCLKKIQGILKSSQAAIEGMDKGGIRCDVNVSIRQRGQSELGQRVEIKNLNSIKAVQDSIDSEVRRQTNILESGGKVEGETRGWDALTGTSKKLRGKEGEVDYRYMPDAEIPALVIDQSLIEHVKLTLPKLPDQILDELIEEPYALTQKDARSLMSLDDGERVDYYRDIVDKFDKSPSSSNTNVKHIGRLVGNWVLHELGGWLTAKAIPWSSNPVTTTHMIDLLTHLRSNKLTGSNAKYLMDLLTSLPPPPPPGVHSYAVPGDTQTQTVADIIAEHNLASEETSADDQDELVAMAKELVKEHAQKAEMVRSGKKAGLVNFFVGQMMRETGGKVDVEICKEVVRRAIFD